MSLLMLIYVYVICIQVLDLILYFMQFFKVFWISVSIKYTLLGVLV